MITAKELPLVEARVVGRMQQHAFTPRQRDVVWRLLRGWTNDEICADLHISGSWLKKCLFAMNCRTGTQGRVQLALYLVGAMEHEQRTLNGAGRQGAN